MGLKQENSTLTRRLEQLWDNCKDILNSHELQITPIVGIQAASMSKQTTNHSMKQSMDNLNSMTTLATDFSTTPTHHFSTSSQTNSLIMTPSNPITTFSSPITKAKNSTMNHSYSMNHHITTCKANMNTEANSSRHLAQNLLDDLHPDDSLNQYLSIRTTKLITDSMGSSNHEELNPPGNVDVNLSSSLLNDRRCNLLLNKRNASSSILKSLNNQNFSPSLDSQEDKDCHRHNTTIMDKNTSLLVDRPFSPRQNHLHDVSCNSNHTNHLEDKKFHLRMNIQMPTSQQNSPVERSSPTLDNKDYNPSKNLQNVPQPYPGRLNSVPQHNQGQTLRLLPKNLILSTDHQTQVRPAQCIPQHRQDTHPNSSSSLNNLEPHVPSYPTLHTWRLCAVDEKPLTLEDLATDSESFDSQSAQLFIFR